MSEAPDLQAVMSRIQKLLRLSKSSNPHEAALAAEKAQELMFAYGLSLAQVEAAVEDGPRFTLDQIGLGGSIGSISWKRSLFVMVARACFCQALWYPGTAIGMAVGRRHNVMLVEHLYEYLQRQIQRMAEADWKRIRSPRFSGTTWKLNFCHGAVDIVAYRLMMKRQSLEDSDPTGKTLVVAEEAGLSKYIERLFPKIEHRKMPRRDGRPGYSDGVLAGQQIRLDDVIEAGGAPGQLQGEQVEQGRMPL